MAGSLRVQLRPRAGRGPGVAVAGDDVEADLRAVGVPRGCPRAVGRGQGGLAQRVQVLEAELPGDHLGDRGDHRGGRVLGLVVAQRGHRPRLGVETARCPRADILVETARASFEDLAVLVDEHVVGDVGPAEAVGVVGIDGTDSGRSLVLGVAVRRRRVVHERDPDAGLVRRRAVAQRLVGPPLGPADHGGLARGCLRLRGRRGRRGGRRRWRSRGRRGRRGARPAASRQGVDPDLDPVGGPGEIGGGAGASRLPDTTFGALDRHGALTLGGTVARVGAEGGPRLPGPLAAGAHRDLQVVGGDRRRLVTVPGDAHQAVAPWRSVV